MNFITSLTHPAMFGPWLSGPSWAAWRAILRAAFAEPMTDAEVATFRDLAERDPPTRRVKEMWIVAGRRAGKDSIAATLATHFALGDYEVRLRPGERAAVMCLAVDREQAKIVLNYIKGYFDSIPGLAELVVGRETQFGFEVGDHVEVVVATNNFRQVRGRTIVCAILDETAFWRSEESATPDTETFKAITPGLSSLAPDSILIGISSPYRKSGLLYEKYKKHYGVPGDVLVIKAPTLTLNPSLDPQIIADALADDPAAASAEWLAEWRSDISAFLSRDLIEAAVDVDVLVRAPQPDLRYEAFTDVSGGAGDAFCAAVAHEGANGVAVLDFVFERLPPFNPREVVVEVAEALSAYGLTYIEGDRYAAQWVVEAFRDAGVHYKHSERNKSEIFIDAVPLFTTGRARILNNKRLVTQFAQLERRTSSSGKDTIDHPRGAHDDLCNAAAGALTLVVAGGKKAIEVPDEAFAFFPRVPRRSLVRY